MVEEPQEITSLQQNDPLFDDRSHLDYQQLRQEGLAHIGALSGKIWTDHNAHDPGVTMLEVLCYALIDLGYRTALPIKDLLTREQNASDAFAEDDNFYTPLEILSNNPTTINDYRRLLLEVEGVRNAWLEPAIVSNPAFPALDEEKVTKTPEDPGLLNGLYSVLLELTSDVNSNRDLQEKVLCDTQELLSMHRNLCEDFHEISLLCPVNIGVFAKIEIEKTASASLVYEAVLKSLDAYIIPPINYYTLQQLLDKGKAIEDIYAGRPFLTESYGFVDIDELENLPQRTELRLSDVYKEILAIDGVVAIGDVSFNADDEGATKPYPGENIERVLIEKGYTPVFSLDKEKTCIDLFSGVSALRFDKRTIERRLIAEKKRQLDREHLDEPVPRGRFLNGLGDYVSIQHEFPLVYGIGDGGLPDNVSLLRQIQALQLKGYLLFYDQLLVDYLAQLSHLRDFFSLQQESRRLPESQHTFFTQTLTGVAALPQLLQTHADRDIISGNTLALPVVNNAALAEKLRELPKGGVTLTVEDNCGSQEGDLCLFTTDSQMVCEIYVDQALRDISQEDYTVDVYEDRSGHFFVIRFSQQDELVLIGSGRYPDAAGAREAANFTTFMAVQPDAYRKASRKIKQNLTTAISDDTIEVHEVDHKVDYHYEVIYNPALLQDFVQELLEDEEQYYDRRQVFLDHLMARFAEQFTDYALLKFGAETAEVSQKRQMVEDKSRFLDAYDEVGRNRGRAYNYLETSWGTPNVSGFEKRAALVAGMNDWQRRTLCNFEVSKCFTCEMEDPNGKVLFSSVAPISTTEGLAEEKARLIQDLKDPGKYPALNSRYNGFSAVVARRLFSMVAAEENIEHTGYTYGLRLLNAAGESQNQSSKTDYATTSAAFSGETKFIKEVNAGSSGLNLKSLGKSSRLHLDAAQLTQHIHTHIRYKWYQYDPKGKEAAVSEQAFGDQDVAMDNFVENAAFDSFVTQDINGYRWQVGLEDGLELISAPIYNSEAEARKGWARSKNFGKEEKNYTAPDDSNRVALTDDNGRVLAWGRTSTDADIDGLAEASKAYYVAKNDQVSFNVIENVCGYQLCDRKGEKVLLTSIYCYAEKSEALSQYLLASEEARKKGAFQVLGSDGSPEYLIQFRSNDGQLWATSEQYDSEKERDAALRATLRELKAHHKLVEVKEEPAVYSWSIESVAENRVQLRSGNEFASRSAAQNDLVRSLVGIYDESRNKVITDHLYKVETALFPSDYQYLYWGYQPKELAAPLLKSERVYPTKLAAQEAYAQFVEALPNVSLESSPKSGKQPLRVTLGKKVSAVLYDEENQRGDRERVDQLLQYMREVHERSVYEEEGDDERYFYRLLNTDFPAAISCDAWPTRDEAMHAKVDLCTLDLVVLDPKKPVLRVVCPEASPNKYHFALFLKDSADGQEAETPVLISYAGYASREEAILAGKEMMFDIISLASNENNIGVRPISLEEVYGEVTGACVSADTIVAVVPDAFKQQCGTVADCKKEIVRLSCRYPIRIAIPEQGEGSEDTRYNFVVDSAPPEVKENGEHEEADTQKDTCLWRSQDTYGTAEEAEAAYRYFYHLMKYAGNCRVVCQNGEYRVMVIEVLLRSATYFGSPYEAWGEAMSATDDPCNLFTGVRELTRVFEDRSNYEPYVIQDCSGPSDCHQFRVTTPAFQIARMAPAFSKEKEAQKVAAELCEITFQKTDVDHQDDPEGPCRVIINGDTEAEKYLGYVYPKNEVWRFRLTYAPEGGLSSDQELEICGCEKKTEEQQDVPSYVFESCQTYPTKDAAESAFDGFLAKLGLPVCYRIDAETEMGPYYMKIVDPEQILAFSPNRYATHSDALAAIDRTLARAADDGMHLVEHILLRPNAFDNNDGQCLPVRGNLRTCEDDDCELTWQEDVEDERCSTEEGQSTVGYLAGADPYSFWATLVMPGWLQRFQSEERRFLFRQMLHREAPALVGLNILWLSPAQMCDFEQNYKQWLDWQQDCTLICNQNESPLDTFIKCIEALREDPLCLVPDPAQGDCIPLKNLVEEGEPDQRTEQQTSSESPDSIYWLDCLSPAVKEPPVYQPEPDLPPQESDIITEGEVPQQEVSDEQAPEVALAEAPAEQAVAEQEEPAEQQAVVQVPEETVLLEKKDAADVQALPENTVETAKEPVRKKATKKQVATQDKEAATGQAAAKKKAATKKKAPVKKKAPAKKKTVAKEKTTKKKRPNLQAVQAMMAARNQTYQERLAGITVKSVTSTEAYARAGHFLKVPPTLMQYERIMNLLAEQDFKSPSTKTYAGFSDVLKATTWSLLDYLIRENGGVIPDETQTVLRSLLTNMKDKGIDLSVVAGEWNSEPLAKELLVSIHKAYISLLEEV